MPVTSEDISRLNKISDELYRLAGGNWELCRQFPRVISDAVEYVIDPVRTARTKVSELDNVEKTFIGLKVEHFLRDFLDVPKGIRDFRLADEDVDVKNTVRGNWMIPPETFRNSEPCILVMVATEQRSCSLGLIIAREEYLNSPNRDGKRSIRKDAFDQILWLVKDEPLPNSRFDGIDMVRFREIRKIKGGNKRAYKFFTENVDFVIHRDVIQALMFDQKDYMKRLRSNGGVRDILLRDHAVLLSGLFNSDVIEKFGITKCGRDEYICHKFGENDLNEVMNMGYRA